MRPTSDNGWQKKRRTSQSLDLGAKVLLRCKMWGRWCLVQARRRGEGYGVAKARQKFQWEKKGKINLTTGGGGRGGWEQRLNYILNSKIFPNSYFSFISLFIVLEVSSMEFMLTAARSLNNSKLIPQLQKALNLCFSIDPKLISIILYNRSKQHLNA